MEDLLALIDGFQRGLQAMQPVLTRLASDEYDVRDSVNDIDRAVGLIRALRHHADRPTESLEVVIDRAMEILRRLEAAAYGRTP